MWKQQLFASVIIITITIVVMINVIIICMFRATFIKTNTTYIHKPYHSHLKKPGTSRVFPKQKQAVILKANSVDDFAKALRNRNFTVISCKR